MNLNDQLFNNLSSYTTSQGYKLSETFISLLNNSLNDKSFAVYEGILNNTSPMKGGSFGSKFVMPTEYYSGNSGISPSGSGEGVDVSSADALDSATRPEIPSTEFPLSGEDSLVEGGGNSSYEFFSKTSMGQVGEMLGVKINKKDYKNSAGLMSKNFQHFIDLAMEGTKNKNKTLSRNSFNYALRNYNS